MSKKIIFPFILLFVSFAAMAQKYTHQDYDWAETPELHELSEDEMKKSAVQLKDVRILEFVYSELGDLNLYETKHKVVKVNEDKAIEAHNKVFVSMRDVEDFTVLKARAISPEGKITELNRDNIKELKDVETYGAFKIFAIEGVEKGSEIEYIYTTKQSVREPFGRITFQSDIEVKEAMFKLISPSNLIFETQSYNGFPKMTETEGEEIRTLQATAKDIPALLEEDYATYQSNLMKVDYKLSYNNAGLKKKELYSWTEAAQYFGSILQDESEVAADMLKKELKALKVKRMSEEQKIKTIENYVKDNFSLEMSAGAEASQIEKILVNKFASEFGLNRLFAAFLQAAEIDFEVVLTSNRFQSKFDKDFTSWTNLTDIIFYFPKYDSYVTAPMIQYRYGYAPYQMAENYGLFFKLGENPSPEVRFISMPGADKSVNKIDAQITFDNDFNAKMNVFNAWTGYRASEFRTIHKYDEKFMENRVLAGLEGAKMLNLAVKNEDLADNAVGGKNFESDTELDVSSLVEKAGKSYLFRLGEVIGSQVELYQEHERQNDIEMQYPTYYDRTISIEIPEGYTVEGLEDAKIHNYVEIDGEKVNGFESDYTIEGNIITINADEFYHTISLPKETYEDFRKVINAAADFNKVVLVLEKKVD